MPPLEWGGYLLEFLWEVGPTACGPAGPVQLPASEIESWQRQIGIQLQPWEFRLLRRLSGDYANESYAATKPDRPPPFAESKDAERLRAAELQRKLDTFLS